MNIRQIAKRAEVSVATVSRVLNHPESVAAKTREKIEKIIAEEEYTPNWFARGLNFNKTGTIGLMIPHILDSVHMETAKGVEDVAHQKGYITFMCNAEEDEEKERRYLEQLIKRRVDGIILISSTLGEEAILNAMEQNVPIVFVGASKFNPGLSTVRV
ncbi:MAG: LacI family DNA-binding transcriptional regulator, partial [Anaerovoracaceae bacterium]